MYSNLYSLQTFLITVQTKFWHPTIGKFELQNSMRNQVRLVKINMYLIYGIALSFATEFIGLAVISTERRLPFVSDLPFDWTATPVYEILFIFQVLTNVLINITSILGHDFLFYALTINVICQFRLLKYVVRRIGSKDAERMVVLVGGNTRQDIDAELLRRCVQHHTLLLKCCDDLEKIFSITVFVQYAASVLSLCVSAFLITMVSPTLSFLTY